MLSSGCKARLTAKESSPEQRSISRSISLGVTIIFVSAAAFSVCRPDTSRARVCASTTVGTPTDMTGTPSVLRLISAPGIADSRARDYAAVGYLNRAAEPAELACGECVDDYHGAGLYHIHGAQEKLARLDPRLPEYAGRYSRDGTQAAQSQLFA